MAEKFSCGLHLVQLARSCSSSAGAGSQRTFHASLPMDITDRHFRAWVYGPELVPVRYRHVGGALNGNVS